MRSDEEKGGGRLWDLFHEAVELPEDEQFAFLERECGNDQGLREAVAHLLEADRQTGPIGVERALELEARHTAEDLSGISTARTFGPYRTTACIGVGGMSIVYRAIRDDDEYRKTVAIKVLPLGIETGNLIERIRRERQILAGLDHPHIAKLLDGGTTAEGLPYLVMEYVEGVPLDVYARRQKLLAWERVEIVLRICNGVQYAHANLVVHCDLKPSNILVTADGTPKLLDFGISKVLDEALLSRTATTPLMTPRFASPEQIKRERITIASDVYSLGVLLFVLLTGREPYRGAADTPEEFARAICGEGLDFGGGERIPGDLRKVIAMATRKEPRRRYGSVEQFAADLGRYLENRPVMAVPDSWTYRASKFVRRHRWNLAITTVCFAAVAFGIGSSLAASRRAVRRFDELRGLAHFLIFDAYDGASDIPGTTELRRSIVAQGQRYLESLAAGASDDDSLKLEVAQAYLRLALRQGSPYNPNLGDTTGALRSVHQARALMEALAQKHVAGVYAGLGDLYNLGTQIYQRQGRLEEASEMSKRGLALVRSPEAKAANGHNTPFIVARATVTAGYVEFLSAERRGSEEGYKEALQLFEDGLHELQSLPPPRSSSIEMNINAALFHSSYAHWRLGDLTKNAQHFESALELQMKGLAISREQSRLKPDSSSYQRFMADNLNEIGYTLTKLGRISEAEASFRESLGRFEKLAAADPSNSEARKDIADVCRYYAKALAQGGRRAEAIQFSRRASGIYKDLLHADPSNVEIKKPLAECEELLAGLRAKL